MGKLVDWSIKARWLLILLVAFLLIYREGFEAESQLRDPGHMLEYLVYIVFLVAVGVLLNLFLGANTRQKQALDLLDQKHALSLELAAQDDWKKLTSYLVKFPNSLTQVDRAFLLVHNPGTNQFEEVIHWQKPNTLPTNGWATGSCEKCLLQKLDDGVLFSACPLENRSNPSDQEPREYCLPIRHNSRKLAVLRFRLAEGMKLSNKQIETFKNVSDEMAAALKSSQERKSLQEMQNAETALAERRLVSHYLHDHLGQNLAYLCLKLGQFSGDESLISHRGDLELMLNAANHSYEIVRGTLETSHPETVPVLSNLLNEHAKKVSKRANLEISIVNRGTPSSISTELQRAVFYVFQEVLSNVEKHARATQVEVTSAWTDNQLLIRVADNGVGFNQQAVDNGRHFGLGIMAERIKKVNGKIEVVSAENSGTTVTLLVPLSHPIDVSHEEANELSR